MPGERLPAAPGSKAPPDIQIVQHRNGGETILNRTWPSALMAQFIYAAKDNWQTPAEGPRASRPATSPEPGKGSPVKFMTIGPAEVLTRPTPGYLLVADCSLQA